MDRDLYGVDRHIFNCSRRSWRGHLFSFKVGGVVTQRQKIKSKINKLIDKGWSNAEIAERLNKQGIRTPVGTEYRVVNIQRFRDMRVNTAPQQTHDNRDDSEIVIDLILKSDLQDARKVALIKNLWGTPV